MGRIGVQEREYLRQRIKEEAQKRLEVFNTEYLKAEEQALADSGVTQIFTEIESKVADLNKDLVALIGFKPLSLQNEYSSSRNSHYRHYRAHADSKVGKLISERMEKYKLQDAKIRDLTREFEDRVMFADLPSSLATVLEDFKKALEQL
jgi:hypothetical protein